MEITIDHYKAGATDCRADDHYHAADPCTECDGNCDVCGEA